MRALAWLEGFTAVLRSGLMAGEGLKELDHPGARQGPRMVACDYGTPL